ncbi:hypothetical protein E4U42_007203 [Claviceps africana]|uniref:Uncharacterized protein n=1 Tax=Claviceps africana TaxID=83212 RepID=A0A8K0NG95_9HYPO|nr:hypothetical protein E4U42_007203 [Claviceps africana]
MEQSDAAKHSLRHSHMLFLSVTTPRDHAANLAALALLPHSPLETRVPPTLKLFRISHSVLDDAANSQQQGTALQPPSSAGRGAAVHGGGTTMRRKLTKADESWPRTTGRLQARDPVRAAAIGQLPFVMAAVNLSKSPQPN